jgi:hypothetical protein
MMWKTMLLLSSLCLLSMAVAEITIVHTGKVFASKPDKQMGPHLFKGYDYMGRLQYVHGNLQLCPDVLNPDATFRITAPTDGLPGTYRTVVTYLHGYGIYIWGVGL